jgi:esterase/lipase
MLQQAGAAVNRAKFKARLPTYSAHGSPTTQFTTGTDAWSIHKGSCGFGWLDKAVSTGELTPSLGGYTRTMAA